MPISKFGQSVANYMENAIQKTFPTVESVAPVEPTFQIFVKDLQGKTVTINDVKASDTLQVVFDKAEEKTGVPSDEMRLNYAGKELVRTNTLADYNIQKEATLHQLLRLRGGAWKDDVNQAFANIDEYKKLLEEGNLDEGLEGNLAEWEDELIRLQTKTLEEIQKKYVANLSDNDKRAKKASEVFEHLSIHNNAAKKWDNAWATHYSYEEIVYASPPASFLAESLCKTIKENIAQLEQKALDEYNAEEFSDEDTDKNDVEGINEDDVEDTDTTKTNQKTKKPKKIAKMVGVMLCDDNVCYAAISGKDSKGLLTGIKKINDIKVITVNTDQVGSLSKKATNFHISVGSSTIIIPTDEAENKKFQMGSCAAPKLWIKAITDGRVPVSFAEFYTNNPTKQVNSCSGCKSIMPKLVKATRTFFENKLQKEQQRATKELQYLHQIKAWLAFGGSTTSVQNLRTLMSRLEAIARSLYDIKLSANGLKNSKPEQNLKTHLDELINLVNTFINSNEKSKSFNEQLKSILQKYKSAKTDVTSVNKVHENRDALSLIERELNACESLLNQCKLIIESPQEAIYEED